MFFCKILIRSLPFQKNIKLGQIIRGPSFIYVRIGGQTFFFKKMNILVRKFLPYVLPKLLSPFKKLSFVKFQFL